MPPVAAIAAVAAVGLGVAQSVKQSKAQEKAAENAQQLAREQQAQATQEQKRLEEKFGLQPGELARQQRLLGIPEGEAAVKFVSTGIEEKQQSELERRQKLSGEELLRETGPETRKLLDQISARTGKTGEELFRGEGAIPAALQEQILAETKDPGKFYQDTLNQSLELARQSVNAEANRRGVFGGLPEGGIRFEQLGRAGVDLAIKSASERMAQRQQALSNASTLATLFQNLSAGARSEAGTVAERALSEKTGARSELNDFLALMENANASAQGRAANVALTASGRTQDTMSQTYPVLQDVSLARSTIKSPEQIGLDTLGKIVGQFGGTLPGQKPVATPTKTSSFEDLMKASELSSPRKRFADYTGAEFAEEYPDLANKRKRGL